MRGHEADLVTRSVAGDAEAFAQLVAPHLARALSTAMLIVGGSGDASDAVQDALMSAWRGLGGLRDPSAFGAWFARHVVRASSRVARRTRRTTRLDESWVDPVDHLDTGLRERQLHRAMRTLSADDRVLLTLRYHHGLAESEVAAVLRVPGGTVKSRLHRSLERLRAAYEAEERR